jgi:sulfoxide reductase heme-binding subunit YedZ
VSSIDLWYTTRATGLVALVLLSATLVLGILTAGRARSSLPSFARVEIHRRLAVLSVVFLAIHVLTSVLDSYVDISWLAVVVPFSTDYHTGWLALGTVGVDLFLAVALSSALRRHISARAWRLWHGAAYLSWPVAVAHALGMGTDAGLPWVLGLVSVCIAGVVGTAAWRLSRGARAKVGGPATVIRPRSSLRLSAGSSAGGK